jgi:hypothetical protein
MRPAACTAIRPKVFALVSFVVFPSLGIGDGQPIDIQINVV